MKTAGSESLVIRPKTWKGRLAVVAILLVGTLPLVVQYFWYTNAPIIAPEQYAALQQQHKGQHTTLCVWCGRELDSQPRIYRLTLVAPTRESAFYACGYHPLKEQNRRVLGHLVGNYLTSRLRARPDLPVNEYVGGEIVVELSE